MHWLAQNWIAIVFVIAVIASYAIQRDERVTADKQQKAAAVAGCVRASVRPALGAAFDLQAAVARSADGNSSIARAYQKLANGLIATIPAPAGFAGSPLLAEIYYTNDEARLTARARRLQRQGCEEAYR